MIVDELLRKNFETARGKRIDLDGASRRVSLVSTSI